MEKETLEQKFVKINNRLNEVMEKANALPLGDPNYSYEWVQLTNMIKELTNELHAFDREKELDKIKCEQCGKTIAVRKAGHVEIKCTGKHEGEKCGHVNIIKLSDAQLEALLLFKIML